MGTDSDTLINFLLSDGSQQRKEEPLPAAHGSKDPWASFPALPLLHWIAMGVMMRRGREGLTHTLHLLASHLRLPLQEVRAGERLKQPQQMLVCTGREKGREEAVGWAAPAIKHSQAALPERVHPSAFG